MINEIHFSTFPTLESERLRFRAFTLSDAEHIQYIRNHDDVMLYMDSNRHVTLEDSEKFIANNLESYQRKAGLFWVIEEKESKDFIGDFSYWNIDKKNARGEIGYTLKPEFWGKGFMKETMITLLGFGFKELHLHSIEANINPKNDNSRKALVKMGFQKEAYFRENYFYNGEFLDSEIYSLLAKDFKFL